MIDRAISNVAQYFINFLRCHPFAFSVEVKDATLDKDFEGALC